MFVTVWKEVPQSQPMKTWPVLKHPPSAHVKYIESRMSCNHGWRNCPLWDEKRQFPRTASNNQGRDFEMYFAVSGELVLSELGIRWCALGKNNFCTCSAVVPGLVFKQTTPCYFNVGRGTRRLHRAARLPLLHCSLQLPQSHLCHFFFFLMLNFQWCLHSRQNLMKCNSKAWISWVRGFPWPSYSVKAWDTNPI